MSPSSGPASGGTPVAISGTNFANPTTVTIGGAAASGVSFVNDHTLNATTPALNAGAGYHVVVTTPDGTTGTLSVGRVTDFLDVPGSHIFNSFVNKLVSNGITAGIGGGFNGVDHPTTRAQMAVFLLRGKNGLCYFPPPATGTVFTDVRAGSFAAAWIEALAVAGVTAGCVIPTFADVPCSVRSRGGSGISRCAESRAAAAEGIAAGVTPRLAPR